FVRPQVPIGQAVHEPIVKRVQLAGRTRLRNAGASVVVAKRQKSSHRDDRRSGEGGICGGGEVRVEFEKVQIILAVKQHVVGRTCGRGSCAVQIGGEQPAYRRILLEADLLGRRAVQHGRTVV